jgi:hypothetical protein
MAQKHEEKAPGVHLLPYHVPRDERIGKIETDSEPLARALDELAWLRTAHDELRRRVRNLEARAGRGILHPSDFYSDTAMGSGG